MKRNPAAQLLLTCLLTAAAGAPEAGAITPFPTQVDRNNPPVIKLMWADPLREGVDIPVTVKSRWIWHEDQIAGEDRPRTPGGLAPVRPPFVRVWIAFPENYSLVSLPKSDLYYRIRPENPRFGPFEDVLGPHPGDLLSLDLVRHTSDLRVRLRNEKGEIRSHDVHLELSQRHPARWFDRTCGDNGILITQNRKESDHLYTGVWCTPGSEGEEDHIDIQVSVPPDTHTRGNVIGEKIHEDAGTATFRVRPSRWESDERFRPLASRITPYTDQYTDVIGIIMVSEEEKGPVSTYEFHVLRERDPAPSELSGSFVPGYLTYSESSGAAPLSSPGMRMRVSGAFTFASRNLEFLSELDAMTFTATDGFGHAWNGSARLAWHLPASTRWSRLKFTGGWSAWGIVAPADAFGLKALFGPEVGAELEFSPPRSRRMRLRARFAPLSADFPGVNFSNTRISATLKYQLSSPGSGRTGGGWDLVLDYARVSVGEPVQGKTADYSAYGLGFGYSVRL